MKSLTGRTALITGAGQGIGLSLARSLAAEGANVVLVDIARDALASAVEEIKLTGARVYAGCLDISDPQSVERLRDDIRNKFEPIEILINNAAIGPEKNDPAYLATKPKFWKTPDSLWQQMLKVNVFGAQLMSRHFAPEMIQRGWGRIVNITTSLDTMYRPGIGAYGPCKAALEALSRVMHQDLEGTGVTVNVLVPGGPVNTAMVPAECGFDPADLIQPEDMSPPLIWLCGKEADDVTGLRWVAKNWKLEASAEQRMRVAANPIAWPQLGVQAHFPSVA